MIFQVVEDMFPASPHPPLIGRCTFDDAKDSAPFSYSSQEKWWASHDEPTPGGSFTTKLPVCCCCCCCCNCLFQALSDSKEDQLCLAAIQYLRCQGSRPWVTAPKSHIFSKKKKMPFENKIQSLNQQFLGATLVILCTWPLCEVVSLRQYS